MTESKSVKGKYTHTFFRYQKQLRREPKKNQNSRLQKPLESRELLYLSFHSFFFFLFFSLNPLLVFLLPSSSLFCRWGITFVYKKAWTERQKELSRRKDPFPGRRKGEKTIKDYERSLKPEEDQKRMLFSSSFITITGLFLSLQDTYFTLFECLLYEVVSLEGKKRSSSSLLTTENC